MKRRIKLPSGKIVGGIPKKEPVAPPAEKKSHVKALKNRDLTAETTLTFGQAIGAIEDDNDGAIEAISASVNADMWSRIFGANRVVAEVDDTAVDELADDNLSSLFNPASMETVRATRAPGLTRLTERLRASIAGRLAETGAVSIQCRAGIFDAPEPAPPIPDSDMAEIFSDDDDDGNDWNDDIVDVPDDNNDDPDFESFDEVEPVAVSEPTPPRRGGIIKRRRI